MKDYVIVEEVFVCDNTFFYDSQEHIYDMTCYDGYADGVRCDDSDELAPKRIRMTYPKLADVLNNVGGLADDILHYRGLYDKTHADINFGDIMMYCGKIV